MKPRVRIKGLERLNESFVETVADSVDLAVLEIARDIRDEARRSLRDGENKARAFEHLARSITITQGPAPFSYTVGTDLEYGQNLEFGTRNSPEMPWFGPSVALVGRDIGNRLRRALNFLDRSLVQRTGKPNNNR